MRRRWICMLALLALPACRPTSLPGEAIGQYRVLGALAENTCGAGYGAPAELFFHVELRDLEQSTLGYWKLPNAALQDGTLERSDGTFRFEHRQEVIALPPQPENGIVGCTLLRTEVVEGALSTLAEAALDAGPTDAGPHVDGGQGDAGPLDGGPSDAGPSDASLSDASLSDASVPDAEIAERDPEEAFRATTTVTVAGAPGSDCSPLLDPSQGGFPFLPCEVRYDIHGTRVADIW